MLCEQETPQKFHYGPSQCNWTLNSWRGHFYDFAKLAFYPLATDDWADHKPWSGTVEPHLTCLRSPTPQLNRLWREKAKESIEIIKQQNPNGLPAQCSVQCSVLNCSPPNRLRPAKTKETTGRETASQALTTITNQVSSSSVFFLQKIFFRNVRCGDQSCIIPRWIRSRWRSEIFANFDEDRILLLTAQSANLGPYFRSEN